MVIKLGPSLGYKEQPCLKKTVEEEGGSGDSYLSLQSRRDDRKQFKYTEI